METYWQLMKSKLWINLITAQPYTKPRDTTGRTLPPRPRACLGYKHRLQLSSPATASPGGLGSC